MKKWIVFFLIVIALFSSLFFYNNFFHDSSFSLIGFAVDENNLPGNVKNPAGEVSITPTQLMFGLTDTQKTVTVSVTDLFVFKEVYICKKPCAVNTDWSKIGEFDSGTRIPGTNYFDARTGITKSFVIQKDIVNSGNNFVAVYTCKGVGNCNENKWLYDKFKVQFAESIVPLSCDIKSACSTGETNILELSDISNAHLAIAGSGFGQKVCCSSGTSIITVGSGDTILYLDTENNAHSFATQSQPVQIKMSIHNSKIRCIISQQSCNLIGYDTCILSLTDLQNGHSGSCTSHTNKICCSRLDETNLCNGKQNGFSCDSGKVCSNGQCISACAEEGQFVPVVQNPPSCCSGLTKINPKAPTLGISGICTSKCGNGQCESATETSYNCPADCGAMALSCTPKTTQCDQTETPIYTFSDSVEGHIAATGYSNSMCCKINGFDLTTTCGTTMFVGSADTDAHIQAVGTSPAYNNAFDYCLKTSMGNINCRTVASCATDETCVGSISDVADGHIGACATFSNKVCCKLA